MGNLDGLFYVIKRLCGLVINIDKDRCIKEQQSNHIDKGVRDP